MTVSIYAYRTLLWIQQQNSDDVLAMMIPEEVLPADERLETHNDMAGHGWLQLGQADAPLGGGPDFSLSSAGKRRARRWADEYMLHSTAYEILQALNTTPGAYLQSVEEAFDESDHDPVTGERPTPELMDQAGGMLYQHQLVDGVTSDGHDSPARLELTQRGREIRRERYVPGLSGSDSSATTGTPTMNQYTTHISGGAFGALQFGNNNQATVGDVHSELNQQFQTLRELANSQAVDEDRQEVLGQIDELEAAARQGSETFETVKNSLLSGFASKLGDRAVSALLAISPLIARLNG